MRRGRERAGFVALFLLPATALYGLFVVLPVAQAFGYSLFRWRGVSVQKQYIGLDNFRHLAADRVFWQALAHNLELLVFGSAAILLISLALAHALQRSTPAARLLRG